MNHILKSIVNELVESGIIKESDSAIYYFGLYEGGIFLFNVLLTLVIASIMQNLWTGIVFFLSFFPVRRYAGGFHAKTRRGCFLISTLVVVGAMRGIDVVGKFSRAWQIMALILSALLILILAPVPNVRKSLNATEIKVYKRKLWVVLIVECACVILLEICGLESYMEIIVVSLMVCLELSGLGSITGLDERMHVFIEGGICSFF